MTKIRRANFVFVAWIGDHSPYHVHVYKDRRQIVKWDLENETAMQGTPTRRILKLIKELQDEGEL